MHGGAEENHEHVSTGSLCPGRDTNLTTLQDKSETEMLPLKGTFLVPLTAAEDWCIHVQVFASCDKLTSEIDTLEIF